MPKTFRIRVPSCPSPSAPLPRRASAQLALAPTALVLLGLASPGLGGCDNNPYPSGESARSVIYTTLTDDPRTLDPTKSYTVVEGAIVDEIYPSFFKYHYLKRPFKLELSLGAQMPLREPYTFTKVEKGVVKRKIGERYTFHIKHGLKFQDDPCFPGGKGREIVAKDFIYSFRRMADPTTGCPVVTFFQDKIIGMDEYVKLNLKRQDEKKDADYQAPVAGLQVDPKDPYTFRIALNQPYPQLRYLMAMHFTTPLAHEAIEKYGPSKEFARHPVGCGAYKMAEYTSKRRIVLVRNPNTMRETYPSDGEPGDREAGLLKDAGKQLPLTDEIVFSIVKENLTAWNMFQQGYLDSASVTQDNFNQVVMPLSGGLSPELKARGAEMKRSATANIYYFCFNMRDPVFGGYDDKRRKLRQAVSLAINTRDYIDLFSQGLGKEGQFILPPGLFGYDDKYKNPYRQYDPKLTRAKQLLKEAGYPNGRDAKGERLTLYFDNANTDAAGRQVNALVKRQVESIGLRLESRVARSQVWQDKLDKGQFQFIKYGWFADYPDPENFIFLLYGPNGQKGGVNYAGYNNPEYNRLFEQMRSMDDTPARLALIKKMRAIAVEDCPWIYLNHGESLSLSYNWMSNVKPHPIANDTLKYRGIDGPRRAALQRAWNRPWLWPLVALAAVLGVGIWPATVTLRHRHHRRLRNPLPDALMEGHGAGATDVRSSSGLQGVKH